MRDAWQLPLRLDGTETQSSWAEVLQAARLVIERYGVTETAEQLNESTPYLRHALAERNRHFLKFEHVPTLIQLDDQDLILKTLVAQKNYRLEQLEPPDPQDLAEAYEEVLAESFGLDVRIGLKTKVLAKARANAGRRGRKR